MSISEDYNLAYNFTVSSPDDDLTPYIPLPYSSASSKFRQIADISEEKACQVAIKVFEKHANFMQRADARAKLAFGYSHPAIQAVKARIRNSKSIHEMIKLSNQIILQGNEVLKVDNERALRRVINSDRKFKEIPNRDLNEALLESMIDLVEQKKSNLTGSSNSLELLQTATKVANLQQRIGLKVQNPLDLAKQSNATTLKKINTLHEHKLHGDRKFLERITKLVQDTLFMTGKQTSYKPTSDEGVAGINGSYFIESAGNKEKLGVFKPFSEQNSLSLDRHGDDFGKIARATYILDARNDSAAYAPITVVANGKVAPSEGLGEPNAPRGHVLAYVDNLGQYADLSWDEQDSIPISEVHRQLTFRGRLYDPDAHGGNILWTLTDEGTVKLIPIDMDYALISLDDPIFPRCSPFSSLLLLDQAKEPYQKAEKEWIHSWDIEGDADALRELGLKEGSVQLMRFTSWTYQMACEELTPSQINKMLRSHDLKDEVQKAYADTYSEDKTMSKTQKDELFEKRVKEAIAKTIMDIQSTQGIEFSDIYKYQTLSYS